MGTKLAATTRFHAMGESLPVLMTESGNCGNPRGPVVPKNEVVIPRNAKPEMMKETTNLVLEIFISFKLYQYMKQDKTPHCGEFYLICSGARTRTWNLVVNSDLLYH